MKDEPNDITELRRRVAKANELSGGYDNRGNHVLGAFLTGILQEYDTLRAERDALRTVAAFFRSVILSGEQWSEQCQEMYDAALAVQP